MIELITIRITYLPEHSYHMSIWKCYSLAVIFSGTESCSTSLKSESTHDSSFIATSLFVINI